MIEQLEALITLNQTGTMAAAATRLRLSPSAISKRIALLEDSVGYRLAEPRGRKVELTPAALRLVERMAPLLAEMRSVLADEKGTVGGVVSLGVTESVLASWGPGFLRQVNRLLPDLELSIHAHRSPVVVDRVRSGEYMVGICAGVDAGLQNLRSRLLTREPMVIVPSGLKKFSLSSAKPIEVYSIESHALSWDLLRPQLRLLKEERGLLIKVGKEVESFASVVQLAKAGFGHGLAPLGIVRALGVRHEQTIRLPGESLHRGVSYVARASTLSRPSLQAFFEALDRSAAGLDWS